MSVPILVSVVIPFMNEETFLEETIQSVIQQDYKLWELLLVDDGSTNKSTVIAKKYAVLYPEKIFYFEHINHTNKGVCASRNLGVEKSKGRLISFVDADDVLLPSKLSNQVNIFRQNPQIGMIIEASEYWFNWNDDTKDNVIVPVGSLQDTLYNPPQLLYTLYPLCTGAAPVPCSWMLTREAVLKVGGFEEAFTKKFQLFEDQAFLCKVYLNERVFVSSTCNNRYRQRPESVVKWVNASGHYKEVRKFFLDWFIQYLQEKNIHNEKLNNLIKKSLFPYNYPTIYYLKHSFHKDIYHKIKKIIPTPIKKIILSQSKRMK